MSENIKSIRADVTPATDLPSKSASIARLGCVTRLDLSADEILTANIGKFDGVVLVGYTADGEVRTVSSYADGGNVLWLMEVLRNRLMSHAEA